MNKGILLWGKKCPGKNKILAREGSVNVKISSSSQPGIREKSVCLPINGYIRIKINKKKIL